MITFLIVGGVVVLILFLVATGKKKDEVPKKTPEEKEQEYLTEMEKLLDEYLEEFKDLTTYDLEFEINEHDKETKKYSSDEDKIKRLALTNLLKKKTIEKFENFFYNKQYNEEGVSLKFIREQLELIKFYVEYKNMKPLPTPLIKECENVAAMMEVEKVKTYTLPRLTTWVEKHKPYQYSTIIADYLEFRKDILLKEDALKKKLSKLKREYSKCFEEGDEEKSRETEVLYNECQKQLDELVEFTPN